MDFAISEFGKVDVNEENKHSFDFYRSLGFKTYERTDKDDQGKNYLLLRMKLDDGRRSNRISL